MDIVIRTIDPILEMLKRWGTTDERLAEVDIEINEIEEKLSSVTDIRPAPLTGLPRGSDLSDKTAKAAERYDLEKSKVSFRLEYLQEEKKSILLEFRVIDAAVKQLSVLEQSVLSMRYRKGLSFPRIADRLHRSEEGITSIEKRARKKLKKIIIFSPKS